MKILLVEDETPKRKHIELFLRDCLQGLELTTARSVKTAITSVEDNLPDLLLLDMSLPTFDVSENEGGGRPQGYGGIEVIRYMVYSEISCPIIVITGYEAFPKGHGEGHADLTELREHIHAEFGDLVKGVVHFNSAYDQWKNELIQLLAVDEYKGQK